MEGRGVDIEIVEECKHPGQLADVNQLGVIVPNAVWINDVRVLGPKGVPITITTGGANDDVPIVNLSLFARSVKILAAEPEPVVEAALYEALCDELDMEPLEMCLWMCIVGNASLAENMVRGYRPDPHSTH